MTHPKNMSAKEWRDWLNFCTREKLIGDPREMSESERIAAYEKAWNLAIERDIVHA